MIFFFLFLLAASLAYSQNFTPISSARGYKIDLELELKYLAQKPGVVIVEVPLPYTTERQSVRFITTSPPLKESFEDKHGNKKGLFELYMKDGELKKITLSFQVQTFHAFYFFDPWKRFSPVEKREAFLEDDPLFKIAATIAEKETPPFFNMKNIYDFCINEIAFFPKESLRSLDEVIKTKKAQCSDLVRLFLGLCKISGIDGRYAGGISLVDGKNEINELHAWAEVNLAGSWIPVDPTLGRLSYKYKLQSIGELRPQYVLLWKGEEGGFFVRTKFIETKNERMTNNKKINVDVKLRIKYQSIEPWKKIESGLSFLPMVKCLPLKINIPFPKNNTGTFSQKHIADHSQQLTLSIKEQDELKIAFKTRRFTDFKDLTPDKTLFLATLFIESKQYADAIDCLANGIKDGPVFPDFYRKLVMLYSAYGQWDRAINVVEVSGNFFQDEFLIGEKGLAYFQKGDLFAAIKAYREAAKLAPNIGWHHCMLGMLYAKTGRRKEAIYELEKGLNLKTGVQNPNVFKTILLELYQNDKNGTKVMK